MYIIITIKTFSKILLVQYFVQYILLLVAKVPAVTHELSPVLYDVVLMSASSQQLP